MVAACGGFLIPVHGLGHVFCRADAVFVAIAQPVLPGNVARLGSLREVGESGLRVLGDAFAVQIHQAQITRRFHMPRLLRLLKVRLGMLVILFLIQGNAFVQQGFRLFVMMRNGRTGDEKGGGGRDRRGRRRFCRWCRRFCGQSSNLLSVSRCGCRCRVGFPPR